MATTFALCPRTNVETVRPPIDLGSADGYGAAMLYYGFGTPVRALPISRYLEMPRETVRRHMGRLVALGLFERAQDQTFVPTK
jgi:hypothetical protein